LTMDVRDFEADRYEREERAALRDEPTGNGKAGAAADLPVIQHLTELGNARRFVLTYGDRVRFMPQSGRWLIWNGRRWSCDELGEVERLGKQVTEQIWDEIQLVSATEEREQIARWAKRSESARAIAAMLRLAQSPIPDVPSITVTVDQLDRDPWTLNLENGSLDLRTGELRPHERRQLCTKLAPVTFDASAPCDRWLDMLGLIFDQNADVIDYLQRAVGYSLTGDVSEHVLFFLHGSGENGKSTLVETIANILGDYARVAAPGLLLAQKNETHPTGLADLAGARFVSSIEADEGRQLAEALVKWVTGGDKLKARFLFRDFFEFRPLHKLWFVANHKPVVRGTDHAIWRRIHLIRFDVCISKVTTVERDFGQKLRAEYPGILRWAVEGCLRWQRQGLDPPAEVTAATESYRAQMDVMAQFLEERCEISPGAETAGKALFAAFNTWCEENGERPGSQKAFSTRLEERGFEKRHTKTGRTWRGLRLL
jgi:putative DNA primase/helicase